MSAKMRDPGKLLTTDNMSENTVTVLLLIGVRTISRRDIEGRNWMSGSNQIH